MTEDNSGLCELNNIWSVGKNSVCIQMALLRHSEQLHWAKTWVWSLTQIKWSSLLLTCRNLVPISSWEENLISWQKSSSRNRMESWDTVSAIITISYPSPKLSLEKPSWAQELLGSQWFSALYRSHRYWKRLRNSKSLLSPSHEFLPSEDSAISLCCLQFSFLQRSQVSGLRIDTGFTNICQQNNRLQITSPWRHLVFLPVLV